MNILYKPYRFFKKSKPLMKIVIVCMILYSFTYIVNKYTPKVEGFEQEDKFLLKEGNEVFDNFYVDIYDQLTYEPVKNKFELGEIVIKTVMEPRRARVLDIGSGTGNHLRILNNNKVDVTGIELSPSMVSKSKEKHPEIKVLNGDAMDSMIFPGNSFTHIQCLSMTLYYIKNKKQLFENCYRWLMPGGYLSIHLVNKDKFNPILRNANPLFMISPQKHAKNRITESIIQFNDFHYKRDFKYEKGSNIAYFEETIKDENTNKVRKNNHVLYMESQKEILTQAKDAGFILKENIDLVNCQHEYEYIYILYKPE